MRSPQPASQASSPIPYAIQTVRLSRIYQRGGEQIAALSGINLLVEAGAFVLVVGPSGCGKSTLLHLLGGIDRPTSGALSVMGMQLEHASEEALTRFRREHIGFVFQFYNLLPFISARENAALPLMAMGIPRKQALVEADAVLAQVGLEHRRLHKPAELSGGEQQRVAIARAIIAHPSLVLADEPTGDLDSANTTAIMGLMRSLNQSLGITCVVSTHNERLVEAGDLVFTLFNGHRMPQASGSC